MASRTVGEAAPLIAPGSALLATLGGTKRPQGRTILLAGAWGSGKTFLWKYGVVPRLQRPSIYVSAFGADSAASLKGRLLTHYAIGMLGRAFSSDLQQKAGGLLGKLGAMFGRPGRTLNASLNSLGASFLRRADLDPLELSDLLDPETVICIDDVERASASFKIEELLGIANILSEHKGFDVVLICNEGHLLADPARAPAYSLNKEKVISAVFHVSADAPAVFERLAEAVAGSDEARRRVQAARAVILPVFKRSKTENLRVLARVLGHLEAMCAQGIRELTETEVRVLTAFTVSLAIDLPREAGFFDFTVYGAMLGARGEDPVAAERLAFLERYLGQEAYEFHPGLFEVAAKGQVDPAKFLQSLPRSSPGVRRTLSVLNGGSWRFWSDARITELVAEALRHLESPDASAAEVLECLAHARSLAELVAVQLEPQVASSARSALAAKAQAGDESVDEGWKHHVAPLLPLVQSEYGHFLQVQRGAVIERHAAAIEAALRAGDAEGLRQRLSTGDQAALEALFERVGLERLLELRHGNTELFQRVTEIVLRQCEVVSGGWPAAAAHRGQVLARLRALAADPNEEHMTRWRLGQLLGG